MLRTLPPQAMGPEQTPMIRDMASIVFSSAAGHGQEKQGQCQAAAVNNNENDGHYLPVPLAIF